MAALTAAVSAWPPGDVAPPGEIAVVTIPAGRFTMGTPPSEPGRGDDETPHDVRLSRPIYLGAFEITQAEWRRVMGGSPSAYASCDRCPVERVNYFEALQFISQLNRLARGPIVYRLPTESEWEYACRAGTTTPFATGMNLTTDQANYNGRFPYSTFAPGVYREHPVPVGTFPPNAWGVYDMHGNVWEWTSDWYGRYPSGPIVDPRGPESGVKRVIRGGSWYFDANSARCGLRYTHAPEDRGFSLGFRVAADPRR